jgi:hypothetical protein
MSWVDKRREYQKRFDELSQENIQRLITDLNSAVGNYIAKGGISQDPNNNPDYNNIISLTLKAKNIKNRYDTLNNDIIQYLSTQTKNNDLAGILSENGELQDQINKLEKIQTDIKVDVDSAIARDELLRSRNTNVTRHDLFLLDRPVRRGLVPYLWAIAVLFIGIGLVIFKVMMPSIEITSTSGGESFLYIISNFITNKIVLGSLLIAAGIVIIFLSLKIGGVFGK